MVEVKCGENPEVEMKEWSFWENSEENIQIAFDGAGPANTAV